jgi:methylmalonyl-CoA mutase cobalamin-binding subunit
MYEEKIAREGIAFLGVDAFFGPGTELQKILSDTERLLKEKRKAAGM